MTKEPSPSCIRAGMLRAVPLFAELAEAELEALAAAGSVSTVPACSVLCKEGDPGDRMYVVIDGEVRVHQDRGETGNELARLGPGGHFGEMALIDGRERSANVSATVPCDLFSLRREAFFEVLSDKPQLAISVLLCFSKTIRNSNHKMIEQVLEQERLKTAAELQRHRSISQMVAGLAHEINTPLGIINQAASIVTTSLNEKTYEQLARDEAAKGKLVDVHDAASLILSNSKRARTLVTSFKNLSVRQITDTRETIDLGELVSEVVGLYRLEARTNKLELSVDVQLTEGERDWDGYPGYLSQILLNLIQNVDRYAYPDGNGGPADILVTREGDGYLVRVADRGVGIPEKHLGEVCTPFFTTGRSSGGTGLGMAIVHNLITIALGGAIDIESAEGEGTRVTLTFPRAMNNPETSDVPGSESSP